MPENKITHKLETMIEAHETRMNEALDTGNAETIRKVECETYAELREFATRAAQCMDKIMEIS